MPRRTLQALAILVLVGPTARAQVITAGATLEGDYLRAIGIYNERTAVANQINANTFIMLNEYLYNCIKNETRENAEHRAAILERKAQAYKALHDRIHDHPDSLDVMNGGALNAKLQALRAPTISESAARYAQVPLDADVIRRIPFQLAEKGETLSMSRLSPKGKNKWAVAFRDPSFASYRRAYERAIDEALELAIEGKMPANAIKAIEQAVDELEDKMKRTPDLRDPKNQRLYHEAKEQVDRMRDSARLFKTARILRVIGEIDSYSGTTVHELHLFMQTHGLTFAPADTPEEKDLYPRLYTALVVQRQKITGAE